MACVVNFQESRCELIYCPYTDCDLPENETSSEHIVPLSLGGANGFEIPVDADFNSNLGSELDGALANEFFVALRRTEYDARGHSGKEPLATIKRATYGEDARPAQVHIHRKHGIKVWDARDCKFKENAGTLEFNTLVNIYLPVRFTAKVALAAGYFTYGDLFREHVDHRQLREVMNIDPAKLDLSRDPDELGLSHLTLTADDYFLKDPSDPNSPLLLLRKYCSSVRGSVVLLVPGSNYLRIALGILGKYPAMVTVPANTRVFPNAGDYAWGHVLAVVDKKLRRRSWMAGLKQWADIANRNNKNCTVPEDDGS